MVPFPTEIKKIFAAVYLCIFFMSFKQLCQLVESQTCDIIIEDELWPLQWYLNKSEGDQYDMNVLPAWRSCINGTGVTVGVVDKGVQDHIDLKINKHIGFGDVNAGTVISLQHGTRVAGIIGALTNKNFTIGIAFGSEIAGIQNDLSKVPNGEACSAMMVAAFTAKGGAKHHEIVTTDVGNKSTGYFNHNSAAVPMVSGAVALAFSANPKLSYRDVMHLLVLTSRGDLPEFKQGNYFIKNAANLSVSSYFGFGLLDMGALVKRSRGWNNVPVKESCNAINPHRNPVESPYNFVHVHSCNISYTEHVEVSLKVNHRHAGQIQWVLISPHGTRSTILPGRILDSTKYMNFTVLTVQMWGETPNGYWTLEPTALFEINLDGGTVELISLTIHGFNCSSSDLKCLKPAVQDKSLFTTPLPDVTDKLPDVTDTLPDVTDKLPDVTDRLPDVTDKLPDVTDKLPDVTDKSDKRPNSTIMIIIVVVLGIGLVISGILLLCYVKKKKQFSFKDRLRIYQLSEK
ncbi:furin-like protease 1 isoform X3 [Mytilus trossulus]|uniref:furin-like protease 1 isoform X3 n=1 Tax=Mytilus trossulus TaxID=6551 RepID=UPI0030059D3F